MQDGRRFSLVLFWYHSRARVEAGGMEAWLWMAWDTFSSRHNDISLVPVIVPVSGLEEWLREG